MRRASLFFGLFILLFIMLSFPIIADEQTENLVSRILDDFDNPDQSKWTIRGSKFATEGFPQILFPDGKPDALVVDGGADNANKAYKVMGVHGKFDRQGYNYIELIPEIRDENGELLGIPISGRVKRIDLWALGSNYDFYLEVHLTDYRGVSHVLNFGSIKYIGWKNLKVDIPSYIPQQKRYAPQIETLRLSKIVMWTRPEEKVSEFFLYLDQIKVLTDEFITKFDGDSLLNPEKTKEIWGGGNGAAGGTGNAGGTK